MNELKTPFYYKAIGLGIVPLFFGVLSASSVTVSADAETSATEVTQTSQQAAAAPATASSNSTAQSSGVSARPMTKAPSTPATSTTPVTATPAATVDQQATGDQQATSGSGAVAGQTRQVVKTPAKTVSAIPSQSAQNQSVAAQNPTRSQITKQTTGTSTETPTTQKAADQSPAANLTKAADKSTADSSTGTATTTAATTNQSQTKTSKIDNSTAATKPKSLTSTQLTALNQLVKTCLTTYDQQHKTNYQVGTTTNGFGRIQTQLTGDQAADQQTLYNHLNQLLDNFVTDNRRYLLTNLHVAGVDLAFDSATSTGTTVNAGKTLVIPVKVVAVDQNGRVLETIQLKDGQGNDLEYGGSWETTAPTVDGYTAVTTVLPANATGVWNDQFNYDTLNADGAEVVTYSYLKNAPAPTTPTEPEVQPTVQPTNPPVTILTVTQPTSPVTQPVTAVTQSTTTPTTVVSGEAPVTQQATPVTVTRPTEAADQPASQRPQASDMATSSSDEPNLVAALTRHIPQSATAPVSRPVVVGTQPITWTPVVRAAKQAAPAAKSPTAAPKRHRQTTASSKKRAQSKQADQLAALQRHIAQSVVPTKNDGSTAMIMNPLLSAETSAVKISRR